MTHMETPATNNTIAFLMASNNEDIAVDLANEITALKLELERVKGIAMHRLEIHAQRMTFIAEREANLARELASRFPLTSELVSDAPKKRPIRDREREELDAMIAKNNEHLDAVGARMTFVDGRWVIAERVL